MQLLSMTLLNSAKTAITYRTLFYKENMFVSLIFQLLELEYVQAHFAHSASSGIKICSIIGDPVFLKISNVYELIPKWLKKFYSCRMTSLADSLNILHIQGHWFTFIRLIPVNRHTRLIFTIFNSNMSNYFLKTPTSITLNHRKQCTAIVMT